MLVSESARHLAALAVVALAVAAQSAVTQGVGAAHDRHSSNYGVHLLQVELMAPLSPSSSGPLAVPPSAAEPHGFAADLFLHRRAHLKRPSSQPASVEHTAAFELPRLRLRELDSRLPSHHDSPATSAELTVNETYVLAH